MRREMEGGAKIEKTKERRREERGDRKRMRRAKT